MSQRMAFATSIGIGWIFAETPSDGSVLVNS
jgi:hypothetical protein